MEIHEATLPIRQVLSDKWDKLQDQWHYERKGEHINNDILVVKPNQCYCQVLTIQILEQFVALP